MKVNSTIISNTIQFFQKDNQKQFLNKNKISTLAPYIAEIQRRKKIKLFNKNSQKNIHLNSSRSFRIKQKSSTSLHKQILFKSKQNKIGNIIGNFLGDKIKKQRKSKSVNKYHIDQSSKTLQTQITKMTPTSANNNYQDLYVRVKSKIQKERKKQIQTIKQKQSTSQLVIKNDIKNIAATQSSLVAKQISKKYELIIRDQKKQKKGFRRNKYENLNTSVGQQNKKQNNSLLVKQQYQSDGKIQLQKKQSNVSINRQMDKIAARQMASYYNQIRNKQINSSIQKSTQKYFNCEPFRKKYFKNQIQSIISTVKDPIIYKISQSTNDNTKIQEGNLTYDFQFQNQEKPKKIDQNQFQNLSEQHSQLNKQIQISDYSLEQEN